MIPSNDFPLCLLYFYSFFSPQISFHFLCPSGVFILLLVAIHVISTNVSAFVIWEIVISRSRYICTQMTNESGAAKGRGGRREGKRENISPDKKELGRGGRDRDFCVRQNDV